MIESLRGIVTLRLAGREGLRHTLWQNRLGGALKAHYAHERIENWQGAVSILLLALETVVLVWLAVKLTLAGTFTVGMIFAFLAWRFQFALAAKSLIDKSAEFGMLGLHLDRLSDIALTEEDPGFAEPEAREAPPAGEVELRNVTYAYGPTEPDVLSDVSLHIHAGEHVAITGPSGSGKSTLAKILVGLLDPLEGEVLVDGTPLPAYGRRALRAHVGAVLQNDLLFAGTIADNVAGFEPVDEERLAEALRAAAIEEDIAAMPMRHLSLVGDMGSTLSGGQVQRILLARALYRRPRLLIMDEGTAHLDAAHERQVNEAIKALGITRIVIAHRRETLAAADRIIRLVNGRVQG
jgi:ATP-binding cassette subfamily B protein RaxB